MFTTPIMHNQKKKRGNEVNYNIKTKFDSKEMCIMVKIQGKNKNKNQ